MPTSRDAALQAEKVMDAVNKKNKVCCPRRFAAVPVLMAPALTVQPRRHRPPGSL